MKFTDIFIRRPVLALVVNLVIIIAGLQAIRALNVRQYPRSENSVVTVTTVYVGASAELVRGFITTPLERAIAAADGIDYIESQSAQGSSTINVRLKLNYDPIKALAEISAKVDQVRRDLPPDAEVPVINVESADSQFASAYLSFRSDVLQQNQITDYLVRVVQPRLSALEGVQRADILGARTFAMRIWLKPERMAALNISPVQVRQALAANNYLAAVGQTKGSLIQVNLTANTDLRSVDDFKRLVIREQDGAVVRLEDIGEVVLGAEDYDTEVRFSGQTAVFMGIWPLPNANSLDVIDRVRVEMDAIQKQLPSGMQARIAYDATAYIKNAIHEVVSTLTDTLLIVVVIIFLFLGSFRSVLIPVVAIPLSLIGAVFLMQVFGFTINLLTLLAIVLSVGLVVDDAIVVVENVERHLSEGKSPLDAALLGARELVGPIIAMTITLAAVYAPIGLQGGLTGSLFREFAFTLAGAVTISGVVALTLSPMMSAKLLKPGIAEHGLAGRIARDFDASGPSTAACSTAPSTRARPSTWSGVVVSLLAVPMFIMSPVELAPIEDQGVIFGIFDAAANSTLEQTSTYAAAANRAFHSVPETDFTFQIIVSGQRLRRHGGQAVGRAQAHHLSDPAGGAAQAACHPGHPDVPGDAPGAAGRRPVPGGVRHRIDRGAGTDPRACPKGPDPGGAERHVRLPADHRRQDRPAAVGDRHRSRQGRPTSASISSRSGRTSRRCWAATSSTGSTSTAAATRSSRRSSARSASTPISSRTSTSPGRTDSWFRSARSPRSRNSTVPRSLNRFQQLNAVKICGVAIRPLDQALRFLEDEAAKILPRGYVLDYTGESRQLRTEGNKFLPALGLAVVLIFLVLAAQFNSFRDPFVILAGSVPLAMFGALIFTFLKMPDPNVPFWTRGLDDDAQHLLPGGAGDARRPGVEERHPHRRVRQPAPAAGPHQTRGRARGGPDAPAPDPDDQRGHRCRALPADARHRRRRRRPQLDRPRARRRHGHRHAVHAVRRSRRSTCSWPATIRKARSTNPPGRPGPTRPLLPSRHPPHRPPNRRRPYRFRSSPTCR